MADRQLHCMTDLETLGKGNKACLLSIGACLFDPYDPSGQVVADFEVHIDPESCVAAGMVIDASTVMWWMDDQRDEARKELTSHPRIALPDALNRFSAWMGEDKPVWGNGATFDNVILRNAYELVGKEPPWKFWNDRCYRTTKNLAPSVKLQRQGVHHSARWDAISQAVHLQQVFAALNISGEQS